MNPYLYQGQQPGAFGGQEFYGGSAAAAAQMPGALGVNIAAVNPLAGFQQMMQQQQQHLPQGPSMPQQQQQQQPSANSPQDMEKVISLIQEVLQPNLRENALLELSKRRETFENLAPLLWYSYGMLVQSIVCRVHNTTQQASLLSYCKK